MNDVLFGVDYLTYYFYLLYYKFIEYPFVVRVCIAVVVLCSVFYLLLAIYLVYGIYNRRREKQTYDRVYAKFYDPVYKILSDKENLSIPKIAERLDHDVKKRLQRIEMRALIQALAQIKSDLGNKMNNYNMQSVQGVFKIGSYFEREIQFKSPRSKIQALLSIQAINGYVSEAVLVRFLYHRRRELRSAARFAYMWLSQSNPFRFFDEDTTMKLSQWEMAEVHMILQHRQSLGYIVPNFVKWVNISVEDSVKSFFVSEIKLFGEVENCPQLVDMLNTKTWSLRNEIVRTLGALSYVEAEPRMIEIYDVQPEYIKRNILEAIIGLNTGEALEFLREAYENADDRSTKLCALKCIYTYNEQGRELFNSLKALTTGGSLQLFAHVEHPITNKA